MNVTDFLKTIYLGDRACKSIMIDGWNGNVRLQVDCISRIRGEDWNFYCDEDLENGFLVFDGVESIIFDPPGIIPNDLINDFSVEVLAGHPTQYMFVLNISSVGEKVGYQEVEVKIFANSLALETSQGSKVE